MFQLNVSDAGTTKLSHPCGNARASFDLLKTYGRDVFRNLIDEMNLEYTESEIGFVWHGSEIAIRCYNHPFTGVWFNDRSKIPEHESPEDYIYPKENRYHFKNRYDLARPPEPAYFSYVHITGTSAAVEKAFNHLNENGFHEGASGEEWIV